VRRVQDFELGERADPAPERSAEAVRRKIAAQPPHDRAGARCARPSPTRSGRGVAHRLSRSVSLPSSGGMVPVSEFAPTALRARHHGRSSALPLCARDARARRTFCMRMCDTAHTRAHARVHPQSQRHKPGCVHMCASHAHTRRRAHTLGVRAHACVCLCLCAWRAEVRICACGAYRFLSLTSEPTQLPSVPLKPFIHNSLRSHRTIVPGRDARGHRRRTGGAGRGAQIREVGELAEL
jgi:hypothetical protein